MLVLNSSVSSFETAALNLSYSSNNSLTRLKSNELLLPPGEKSSSGNLEDDGKVKPPQPKFSHKRVTSNPFDVIYSPTSPSNRNSHMSGESQKQPSTPSPKEFIAAGQHRNLYTPKNGYTPEQFISPTHGHRRVISDIPPVITLIDQGGLTRTSSVISKEASLKSRHSITRRNRMINKKSLDVHSPHFENHSIYETDYKKSNYNGGSSKLKQKIKFMFPVKRNTSLKQRSNYKLLREYRNKRPNFQSKQELEHFLASCNADKIMKEMLPKQMKLYDYSSLKLLSRKPVVGKTSRYFNIDQKNEFHIVSPNANNARFSGISYRQSMFKDEPVPDLNPELNKEFNVVDAIYSRYRDHVFHSNHQIPPKFTEVFPDGVDNNLVTSRDVDNMNKKVLFEVLLRRTLAAKIDYRLKQNGAKQKRPTRRSRGSRSTTTRSDSNSNNSSGSSGDSSKYDQHPENIRHSHVPQLVHTDSETSPDDASINTNDLLQQNVSLFSGLLPSPQISYESKDIGSGLGFNPKMFDLSDEEKKDLEESDGDSRHLRSDNKLRRTASTTDLLNLVKQVTPSFPMEPKFPAESNLGLRKPSNYNWNLDNNDETGYKSDDALSALQQEFGLPQLSHELRPLNRSVDTFSSSEESGMHSRTPPIELSRNNSLKSMKSNNTVSRSNSINRMNSRNNLKRNSKDTKRDSNVTSHSSSSNDFDRHHKRISQSTSNTSIFQDLDDLSDQLSSYMNNPSTIIEPAQRFVHKNVLSANDSLLTMNQPKPINLSNQSILDTIKLSEPSMENITIAESPSNKFHNSSQNLVGHGPNVDIHSMKGSISVVGSETSTNYSHLYPHSFNHNYKLKVKRGDSRRILRRDDSSSTRTGISTLEQPQEEDRVSPTKQMSFKQ